MANNYTVDYNDKRFAQVETEKQTALDSSNSMYDSMIDQSDKYYEDQKAMVDEYANKQTELQNEQTDFAIKKIEENKEDARKDYEKEQKASYVDYQKQVDDYGVNAEQIASAGLQNSGYSESSKVNMYNTYQNRYAIARETVNKAYREYDNQITEARLQNNVILAQIAHDALKEKLSLALEQFQYKNELLVTKQNAARDIDKDYYGRRQDVVNQINTENKMKEDTCQFEAKMKEDKRQFDAKMAEEKRQFNESLKLQKKAISNSSKNNSSKKNTNDNPYKGASPKDKYGNSEAIRNKENYYFSNGYQPRYIDDTELKSAGKVGDYLLTSSAVASQNLWQANGKYYVWNGKAKDYIDVTKQVNAYKKSGTPYVLSGF